MSKRSWMQAGDWRSWACHQELPHLALLTHSGTLDSLLLNRKPFSLCWQSKGPCDCWHVGPLPSHHYECSLWAKSLGRLSEPGVWLLFQKPEILVPESLFLYPSLFQKGLKAALKIMGNPANKPKLNGGRDSVHAHICAYTRAHTHRKTSPTIGKSCSLARTTGFWFTDDSLYFYCHY